MLFFPPILGRVRRGETEYGVGAIPLGGYVRINDWNQYLVVARGGTFLHVINGQLMAVFVDDDRTSVHNRPGLFGIEIEGKPCKVSVRNMWLKKLS